MAKPAKYDLDDFIKPYALEERIYRMRCVEAWSFVIPWVGIPLADVIKRVEPTSQAPSSSSSSRCTTWAASRCSATELARVAVHRRAAPRRGEAPADDPGGRPLRRSAAGAERRADPAGRAVEVRLQGRQVDRQDAVRREPAGQHLAGDGPQRVRLLRQREPDGRSPAVEPGARAAAAELRAPTGAPRCSTATPTRCRVSMPAWISAGIFERPDHHGPARAPGREDHHPRQGRSVGGGAHAVGAARLRLLHATTSPPIPATTSPIRPAPGRWRA